MMGYFDTLFLYRTVAAGLNVAESDNFSNFIPEIIQVNPLQNTIP